VSDSRIIVVTGGFGALGSAVGRVLAGRGATVALLGRSRTAPAALTQEFAGNHLLAAGIDLTDPAAARAAMDRIAAKFGGIDALLNIAGAFRQEKFASGDPKLWDEMFQANLKTAVVATHAALPHLIARRPARIINIGAAGATKGSAGQGAYAASKSGVQRFTESLAEELKGEDITVNAILPGTIDTPQNRADMPQADARRWVAPEAIAEVIAFLLSDAARAITGAAIAVRGRG
jgi:NAD(P)-dependent dehydrogenase (short-subunit alcohol dehydrogenase family)